MMCRSDPVQPDDGGAVLTGCGRVVRPVNTEVAMLKVGDQVEDFEALDHTGATVGLSELLESGPLVLYFYIKAQTPG